MYAVTLQIIMPSGTIVTAKYGCWRRDRGCRLDVTIYPLAEDFDNSEGLCSNFNKNKRDDRVPRGGDDDDRDRRSEPVDFTNSYMSVCH